MALRFTRFTNPHIGLSETQTVATLGQNDEQDAIGKEGTNSEAIRNFEDYFERNSLLEEQPRKRCTRDMEDVHGSPETFRLISSKLPPQQITLQIPPTKISIFRSPDTQDSSEQRRLRRAQARIAAIDGGDIIMQSTHKKRDDETLKTFKTSSPIKPAVALLIQEHEPTEARSKVTIIPTISDSLELPSKKKRRRFKSKPPRLRPAFYRPTLSMGPRATGYALGYQGSWMVEDPSKVPYTRDKMRRGRLASFPDSQHHPKRSRLCLTKPKIPPASAGTMLEKRFRVR